tara:strand:- start:186 stop:335 length:150 start_codon:yes stop_codon:yes gene_type:complete
MNWAEEEVEAEVSRQERQATESAELDAQIQEYYQLDCPEKCYLGCEGEE